MDRILIYSFSDNFIERLADFLYENFASVLCDFSKVACVFGGRRPALFLHRALVKKVKRPFYPPRAFSMDEFMQYVVAGNSLLKHIGDLDCAYLIYQLAKKHTPSILKGRAALSEFLPWAREINSFIEQLDLEDIADTSLEHIEKSAEIGYDVPANINVLLEHIVKVRKVYHQSLNKEQAYSRGLMYLEASRCINKRDFSEFNAIIFCNFFYLHTTESRVITEIYRKGKGVCIFQGNPKDWPVLEKNLKDLGTSVIQENHTCTNHKLSLYRGFDIHSQSGLVREILKTIEDKENTVIIVPRPESLIPLLTEITPQLSECNVSMGYPLKRSSLYALLDALLKSQESRKDGKYYTKDYLNLLRHPLVKNLTLDGEPAITRLIVHKLEELLQGSIESSISGSLFLSLEEIEEEEAIYRLASETLRNMDIETTADRCKAILKKLHASFFKAWENLDNFSDFAKSLDLLLELLVEKSMLTLFAFNLKVIEKLHTIKEELANLSFNQEKLRRYELWKIFQQKIENEVISFSGSPLRGTQILGLLEARSLNFDNVIVMDMNEGVMPKLKIYEPLIPREVMLLLGLNRIEKEEEIQRYQFMRLIACAKNVYLIYEENQEKEKSRFIEELLWKMQKEAKKLEVMNALKASFSICVTQKEKIVKKTREMVEFLKKQPFSASRIDKYLECPLEFYAKYVLGLEEKEALLDEPEASHIGTFIHELLEEAFMRFKGAKPIIDTKFRRYFFKLMEERFEENLSRRMKSDSFLLKRIIENRLQRFLDREIERDVSKIICLEEERAATIVINNLPLTFNYTVDRIDEFKDKSIVIIDYKTGGADISPRRFATLKTMQMNRESIREGIRSFQLSLYYYFVSQEFPQRNINAELYNLRTLERKAFISESDCAHKDEIMRICLAALSMILSEIFDTSVPFSPQREEARCEHCAFRGLCR